MDDIKHPVAKNRKNKQTACKKTDKKKEPSLDDLKDQIRQIKTTYRDLDTKAVSLRWMMKNDGIVLNSNKAKLQEAIQNHHRRLNSVVIVQRFFRGFLARNFWRKFKKGNSISHCVNETDFYTLEPLEEIDTDMLYFYRSGEHQYGFNLHSLLIYYGKSRSIHENQLLNPYNREVMNRKNIQQLLNLTHLFFPQSVLDIRDKPYYRVFMGSVSQNTHRVQSPPRNVVRIVRPTVSPNLPLPINATNMDGTLRTTETNELQVLNIPDLIYNTITMPIRGAIVYNQPIIVGENQRNIAEHLAEIEQLPLNRRIHELFIDFDLLGNYTDARWFMQQNLRGYKVYFIKLNELWNYLPPFVQQSICSVGDPFYLVNIRNIHQQNLDSMRGACLKVMEYITHGGISREDQKLGIYQLLIALTFISREARHSMNHLL